MGTETAIPIQFKDNPKFAKTHGIVNGDVMVDVDYTDDSIEDSQENGQNGVSDDGTSACDDDSVSPKGRNRWRYKKRADMNPTELELARERDRIQSRRRREKAELRRLEGLKEHEIKVDHISNDNDFSSLRDFDDQFDSEQSADTISNQETRKRRVIKKRNRSDMNPEELARLRERERKAQQSRRDRIRAQKVSGMGEIPLTFSYIAVTL